MSCSIFNRDLFHLSIYRWATSKQLVRCYGKFNLPSYLNTVEETIIHKIKEFDVIQVDVTK